jgi:DNA-binding MarR family transcriptional regulator
VTEPIALANDLRTVLGRLVRRLRAERRGLTLAQVSVLGRIDRGGPAGASDLAAGERVRPQSMASTVAALTAAGLVERRPDPVDRRRVLISLTDQGRIALAADRRRRDAWLAEAIRRDLTAHERAILAQAAALLARLADSETGNHPDG